MRALIIEDDPDIIESVTVAFHMAWPGAKVEHTHMGRKGIELVGKYKYDITILDLGLPDIRGLDVLKAIRDFSSVPIIILTVNNDEDNIVKGLEWGADDYVVKPCGQFELLARIKARMRDKDDHYTSSPVTYGILRFDPQSRHLEIGERQVRLTAIESDIIQALMRNGSRVTTHTQLTEAVWNTDYIGSVDSLRVHIRRLREKVENDPSKPKIILTKSGIGYVMAKPEQA
ncbi:MAG: response regulator transcription factor [Dehalococcoidia bacterium]|nr:MAG: response regulator transcription factor [Dehalococcoidia bacterium]